MLRGEITRDLDSLLEDTSTWNRLARGVPFRETSWLGPWWRRFGADKEAFVPVARDASNAIVGLLPLYRSSGRTLAIIGEGQACSDYVSVLAQSPRAEEAATAIGRYLSQCAGDHRIGWDMISIEGVVEGDRPMAALTTALRTGGASLHAQSRMSTWFKPADACWDEHLKHFGKTQRRKMRRWSEKIDKTKGLEKVLPQSPQQAKEFLLALIDLHQRRWNEAGEMGSYADQAFQDYMVACADDFYRRGRLYLPMLSMNDRMIGGELHFLGGDNRLYCYSSGYDVDAAELEPGRVLCVDTLLQLYRENLDGIDYLRGDEPYKKRMAATPRRVFHLRAVAPTLLPKLRHAAWCTRFELKQWMRRRTGRPPVEVGDLTQAS